MAWRTIGGLVLAACVIGLANCPAADDKPAPKAPEKAAKTADKDASSIQYLPLDAPAGMSQAVIVQGAPLVHTRQLVPVDRDGKIVGEGSVDKQIEQVLANLDAVLVASGSSLNKLVRVNVYAISPATVDRVRELLSKRLEPSVRPAITSVLTALTHRKALVAVDAIAVSAEKGEKLSLVRCDKVAGDKDYADAAVLPRGGVVYMSGRPEESGLTVAPVTRSMAGQMSILGQLKLSPEHVVQVKVFLRPATAADEVLREVKKFFPGQLTPPVVFVEWLASVPVEIEVIAQLPLSGKQAQAVEFYNPPDVVPANTFSRVALVRTERQIYLSTLFARDASEGEPQARELFEQLKSILGQTGSDLLHMAKGTYYVSDEEDGKWFDRVRPRYFDSQRPPAASKVTIHGVGKAQRTMSLDMIAVESGK